MKLSLAAVTAILAGLAVAYPQQSNSTQNGNNNNNGQNNNGQNNNGQNNNGNNNQNQRPSVDAATAGLMNTAVNAWMRDTGVVSNFLNNGATYQDDTTFKNQALIAHSAEVDELTHKAVLDQGMPNNQNVKAANATLTNGSFQLVVDELRRMADQGKQAQDGIDKINKVRCVNVLPNIDMYMKESTLTVNDGSSITQSVRPAACGNIQPGVNGAIRQNDVPQGYVNGKLPNGLPYLQQNGNGNGNQNQNQNQNQEQNQNQQRK